MAVSANEIKATYPLPVYNFRVEIGADAVAFSDVSGLSIHYDVTTYKESLTGGGSPGPRIVHMPAQPQPVNVTLKKGVEPTAAMKQALAAHVAKEIGAIARPDEIRFAEGLPKTRSGKIMRRLLRDVAAGRQTTGDTTTLEDLNVLAALRSDEE